MRSKYAGPVHPWQAERIKQEKSLLREFGLKTKSELWKTNSKLKAMAAQAKRLIALRTKQSEIEAAQLLARLTRLGLLPSGAQLNDVLALQVSDILNRRLQTVMVKNGLARTMRQARQFIVHGHVRVGGQVVSAPSYLVPVEDEASVSFVDKSVLSKPDHPEREVKKTVVEAPAESEEEAEEKPAKKKAKPAKKEAKKTESAKEPAKPEKAEEKA